MQFRFPLTTVVATLAYSSAVLSQSGIPSISGEDEDEESSFGPDLICPRCPPTDFEKYFHSQSDIRGEFFLALIFGALNLFGGGIWLMMHYRPIVKKAGASHPVYVWTWWMWWITLLFYTLDAIRTASFLHATNTRIVDSATVSNLSFAAMAFSSSVAAGWMSVLLFYAYAVRKKVYEPQKVSARHASFSGAWIFVALLLLSGGIIRPTVVAIPDSFRTFSEAATIVGSLTLAISAIGFLGACFLFAAVLITRKAAPSVEGVRSADPLRMALFLTVPLWGLVYFTQFILACVFMSNFLTFLVFDPTFMFFGFANLATIAVLPMMVVEPPANEINQETA
ncbi:hypothetical protein DL96DRAFT_1740308 [Flagelloscypha sp. PMI_526]|nr:hypothetical protein DL96DRAFT_1740308 [Flagelloscypha sp. PMI_526]